MVRRHIISKLVFIHNLFPTILKTDTALYLKSCWIRSWTARIASFHPPQYRWILLLSTDVNCTFDLRSAYLSTIVTNAATVNHTSYIYQSALPSFLRYIDGVDLDKVVWSHSMILPFQMTYLCRHMACCINIDHIETTVQNKWRTFLQMICHCYPNVLLDTGSEFHE